MQQVDKGLNMIKYLLLAVFFVFFTGCSSKEDVYVTKRIYKDISKDAVLEAGKKVFLLSNQKKEFMIDSYRNRLKVTKVVFKDRVFRIDLYTDKWLLEVVEMDNESRANLILVRSDAMDDEDRKSISKNVHEVFWARLEYLLGLTKDWKYCQTHMITSFDESLCSNIFTSGKPEDSDMVKNLKIAEKNPQLYTIDTIKSDIYESTDLSLSKNSKDIFLQSEILPNIGITEPVSDESIMEIKALKTIQEKKEDLPEVPQDGVEPKIPALKPDALPDNEQKDEKEEEKKDKEEDKSIDDFQNNMQDIVNNKGDESKVDTGKIISDSDNIKENSQFELKDSAPVNSTNKK